VIILVPWNLIPLAFSVKDLATKNEILISNSTGDLYPFYGHGSTVRKMGTKSST